MAKQLQIRGGTTAQHSTFTGAVREITVDTDKDVVVVHDGSTAGGFPLAKQTSVDSKVAKVTSTDNAIPKFNGTTGELQNSGVTIDDSNNVGIGTSSPAGNLDVYKASSAVSYVRTANQTLKLSADDTANKVDIANVTGTPIGFTIGATERARVSSSGNLLVGTNTDNGIDRLQANGSITFNAIVATDANLLVRSGFYSIASGANCPAANVMIEVVANPSYSWITQKAMDINGSSLWIRNSNTSGAAWTPWTAK